MPFLDRKLEGYQLYYETSVGDSHSNETIVFIHGLGYDHQIWRPSINYLREDYRVIVYDLCGHGGSGTAKWPISWALFYNELFDLLDHLSIKSCHLVGHRFAGDVAIKAYLERPYLFQSLTLVSTPLFFPNDLYAFEYEERMQLLRDDRSAFNRKMARYAVNHLTPENEQLLMSGLKKMNDRVYIQATALAFEDEQAFVTELERVSVPTLFIDGDRDPVYPPYHSAVFTAYIPNSRLHIVPSASNAVFLDKPEWFANSLRGFLSELDQVRPTRSHMLINKKMRKYFYAGYQAGIDAPILDFRVIGEFSVFWKGQRVKGHWNRRNAKELLLVLTMQSSISRERLLDLFFPDSNIDKAKNYLRVMLNHLKGIFANHPGGELKNALSVTRDTIQLTCEVRSDVLRYINTLKHLFNEGYPLSDQKLIFLDLLRDYKGNFLPGFNGKFVSDLHAYAENHLTHAMVDLIQICEDKGRFDDAIQILRECELIEIYDGYCEEKIKDLKAKKQRVRKE